MRERGGNWARLACATVGLAAGQARGGTVLVCPTPNTDGVGYGGYACPTMTVDLNTAASGSPGSTQPTVAAVSDLNALLPYNGLWVDVRQPDDPTRSGSGGTLSAPESAALSAYIATGRRVVLIGGDDGYMSWDNAVLSLVGGGFAGRTRAATMVTQAQVPLTLGMTAVGSTSAGTTTPVGTSLFGPNVAVVAGPAQNVLVLLDTSVLIDDALPKASNARFATNVAAWVAGGLADPPRTWQGGSGAAWPSASNWAGGVVPGVGAEAVFDSGSQTAHTVAVHLAAAVADVRVGTDRVALDLSGGGLTVVGTVAVGTAAGSSGTLSLTQSGSGTVTVTAAGVAVGGGGGGYGDLTVGPGTALSVAGNVAVDGPSGSRLDVAGGVVRATGTLSGTTAVTAGGRLTVGALSAAALTVGTGATAVVGSGPVGTVTALADAGQIDVTGGGFVVRGGDVAVLTALARSGYAGGSFAGPGLTSSVAAADATRLTAVAVVPVGTAGGSPSPSSYGGQTTAVGDVLVGYARFGDVDLNGTVDGRDYTRIDAGYAGRLTGWVNGDFNYDGVVDGSDYTLIDNAFNRQVRPAGAAATAELAAVPEPAVGTLGVATLLALGRCSRRRKPLGR